MDLDVKKIKDVAEDAVEKVADNKQAQKAFDKAAGVIEKKTKIDIPDAEDLAKKIK